VIFESWSFSNRRELYDLLECEGYAITVLPWRPDTALATLDLRGFLHSDQSNFMAVPHRSISGRGAGHP